MSISIFSTHEDDTPVSLVYWNQTIIQADEKASCRTSGSPDAYRRPSSIVGDIYDFVKCTHIGPPSCPMIGDRIQSTLSLTPYFSRARKLPTLAWRKERIFLFCGIYGNSIFFTDADSLIGVILGTVMEKSATWAWYTSCP